MGRGGGFPLTNEAKSKLLVAKLLLQTLMCRSVNVDVIHLNCTLYLYKTTRL